MGKVMDFKESTKKEDVIRKKGEFTVMGMNESELTYAAKHHIWLEGEENKLDGTDYSVHELIMTGLTGFSAEALAGLSFEDVMKVYYSNLYKFVKRIINEYKINRENWATMVREQDEMLVRQTSYVEFLRQEGVQKKYNDFYKESKASIRESIQRKSEKEVQETSSI